METDEILAELEKVENLVSDLRFAAEMAQDQNCSVETMIQEHTCRDSNLLGAVLNFAAVIPDLNKSPRR